MKHLKVLQGALKKAGLLGLALVLVLDAEAALAADCGVPGPNTGTFVKEAAAGAAGGWAGAEAGAATGGVIGSIIPGIGTTVGAVIGGIVGSVIGSAAATAAVSPL